MPNIITHILFADELYENLEDTKKELVSNRLQLFEIGSNGPDFLFFHNFNPKDFYKKSQLRKLGSECHAHSVNEFYTSAYKSIQNEKDKEIKKDMLVYTWGHLCHWALDSVAHPYVFYRTGNCKGKSAWWHHRFESLLDAIMLKVKNGCTTKEFKAYETCEVSLEQARAIARIYVPIARNVYYTSVMPHEILDSLNDWCFMQKVFYDASGNKYNATLFLDKLMMSENMLSGYVVPNHPDDPFDVINLLHTEWCHPCDETITSTESFFDLYDRAQQKANKAIDLLFDALQDESKFDAFIDFIDNQSYDTGLSERKEMKFFNLVY